MCAADWPFSAAASVFAGGTNRKASVSGDGVADDRKVSAAKSTNGPAGLVGHRFERPAGPLLIQLLWCLAPPEDPGRRIQPAGIARSFNRGLLSDQLLFKITTPGHGPAANPIEGFPAKRQVVLRDEARDRVGHHPAPTVCGAEAGEALFLPTAQVDASEIAVSTPDGRGWQHPVNDGRSRWHGLPESIPGLPVDRP